MKECEIAQYKTMQSELWLRWKWNIYLFGLYNNWPDLIYRIQYWYTHFIDAHDYKTHVPVKYRQLFEVQVILRQQWSHFYLVVMCLSVISYLLWCTQKRFKSIFITLCTSTYSSCWWLHETMINMSVTGFITRVEWFSCAHCHTYYNRKPFTKCQPQFFFLLITLRVVK